MSMLMDLEFISQEHLTFYQSLSWTRPIVFKTMISTRTLTKTKALIQRWWLYRSLHSSTNLKIITFITLTTMELLLMSSWTTAASSKCAKKEPWAKMNAWDLKMDWQVADTPTTDQSWILSMMEHHQEWVTMMELSTLIGKDLKVNDIELFIARMKKSNLWWTTSSSISCTIQYLMFKMSLKSLRS